MPADRCITGPAALARALGYCNMYSTYTPVLTDGPASGARTATGRVRARPDPTSTSDRPHANWPYGIAYQLTDRARYSCSRPLFGSRPHTDTQSHTLADTALSALTAGSPQWPPPNLNCSGTGQRRVPVLSTVDDVSRPVLDGWSRWTTVQPVQGLAWSSGLSVPLVPGTLRASTGTSSRRSLGTAGTGDRAKIADSC